MEKEPLDAKYENYEMIVQVSFCKFFTFRYL